MKKTIKEDKKTNTILLKVELSSRRTADDPVVNFLTRDAKLLLLNEGYNVSGCRKKDSITNLHQEDDHSGEWVFSLAADDKKEVLTKEVDSAIIDRKANTTNRSQRKGK